VIYCVKYLQNKFGEEYLSSLFLNYSKHYVKQIPYSFSSLYLNKENNTKSFNESFRVILLKKSRWDSDIVSMLEREIYENREKYLPPYYYFHIIIYHNILFNSHRDQQKDPQIKCGNQG